MINPIKNMVRSNDGLLLKIKNNLQPFIIDNNILQAVITPIIFNLSNTANNISNYITKKLITPITHGQHFLV